MQAPSKVGQTTRHMNQWEDCVILTLEADGDYYCEIRDGHDGEVLGLCWRRSAELAVAACESEVYADGVYL